MPQYNIQSQYNAVQIVQAGDPPTLVINHNTKYTVLLGPDNSVGSGNQLDATLLDAYASIVVSGDQDVWCVLAAQGEPCVVLTQPYATNWTPRQIQPNIQDSNSPFSAPVGTNTLVLEVPPGAQGLAVYFTGISSPGNVVELQVTGVQSGADYAFINPYVNLDVFYYWIPVLSDQDSQVNFFTECTVISDLDLVWIMTGLTSVIMPTGNPVQVTVGETLNTAAAAWQTPNKPPLRVNTGAMVLNATVNLIPAPSAPDLLYLHTVMVAASGTNVSCDLKDTAGNVLATFLQAIFGTPPSSALLPPLPPYDFKGANPVSGGLELTNTSSTTTTYLVTVTYSIANPNA